MGAIFQTKINPFQFKVTRSLPLIVTFYVQIRFLPNKLSNLL